MPMRALLTGLLLLLLSALAFALWPRRDAPAAAPAADAAGQLGAAAPAAAEIKDAAADRAGAAASLRQEVPPPTPGPAFVVEGRVLQTGVVAITGLQVLAYAGSAGDRDGAMSAFAAMAGQRPGDKPADPGLRVHGDPLARAEVAVDGSFRLTTTQPHLRLAIDHDFYSLPLPAVVHVPAATRRCSVLLEPVLGGLLRGVVLGDGSDAGLRVRLFAEPDPMLAVRDVQAYMAAIAGVDREPALTGPGGHFVFRAVPPGLALQLQLQHDGLAARVGTAPLSPGEIRELALPLQPAGRLRVRTVDQQGHPVAAVAIAVQPEDVPGQMMRLLAVAGQKTDGDGAARFRGLGAGPYEVIARGAGFVSARQTVTVAADAESQIEFTLSRGGSVAGTVVDADGKPVAEARIATFPSTEVPLLGDMSTSMGKDLVIRAAENAPCRSDTDGHFELSGIDGDDAFLVVAWHADHAGGIARGVHAGDRSVVVAMELPAKVRGRVVGDEDEQALHDFEIEAAVSVFLGMSRPARQQQFADSPDGSFELDGMMPGDYQLRARAEGRGETSVKVTLRGGATADLGTLRLARGATLEGRVHDADGKPVRGALVRQRQGGLLDNAIMAQMFGGGLAAHTDDHGRFTLRNLAPGKVTLIATAVGFASGQSERIEVAAGQSIGDVDIVLGHGGSIDGRLLVGPGERAEEWQLFAKAQRDGDSHNASVAADGSFHITDLDPGRYEVQAMQPGAMAAIQHQTQGFEPGKGIDIKGLMSTITDSVVSQRCVVRDGETATVTLDGRELGSGGRLDLHVEIGDAPLQSGMAELTMQADGRLRNGFIDGGDTSFGGMQPGPFTVRIRGGLGYAPIGVPAQFDYPRGTDRHRLTMRLSGGELRGVVVDADSRAPLSGVTVRLLHEDDPQSDDQFGFAMTDARGHFAFRALAPGSYGLVSGNAPLAAGEGAASRLTGLRLQDGEVRDGLELRASPAAQVRVRIVDAAGQPIGGGMVLCVDAEGRPFGGLSLSFAGPDGRAMLAGLPAGTARILGRAPGCAPGASDLQAIAPGEPVEFTLQLARGPHVTAQLVDRNGAPLDGAEVAARRDGGPWFPAMLLLEGRGADGSFDLGHLQPGHWQFRVSHTRTGSFTVDRSLTDTAAATLLLTPH